MGTCKAALRHKLRGSDKVQGASRFAASNELLHPQHHLRQGLQRGKGPLYQSHRQSCSSPGPPSSHYVPLPHAKGVCITCTGLQLIFSKQGRREGGRFEDEEGRRACGREVWPGERRERRKEGGIEGGREKKEERRTGGEKEVGQGGWNEDYVQCKLAREVGCGASSMIIHDLPNNIPDCDIMHDPTTIHGLRRHMRSLLVCMSL